MKRILLSLLVISALGGVATAQNPAIKAPAEKDLEPARQTPWSRVPPTEAMWMYEQHKRDFLDPEMSMRRRAEHTAWQRRYRLASTAWYGFSNSRPSWHPTPFQSSNFSPTWSGNDYTDRYRWSTGAPPVVIVPESDSLKR